MESTTFQVKNVLRWQDDSSQTIIYSIAFHFLSMTKWPTYVRSFKCHCAIRNYLETGDVSAVTIVYMWSIYWLIKVCGGGLVGACVKSCVQRYELRGCCSFFFMDLFTIKLYLHKVKCIARFSPFTGDLISAGWIWVGGTFYILTSQSNHLDQATAHQELLPVVSYV